MPVSYSCVGKWTYGKLPLSDRERWFAPAPPLAGIQAPSIQPLEVLQSGSERRIKLRLKANGADRIVITAPADAHVRSAGVTGFVRPIGGDESASGKFNVACTGRSCDGAELIVDAATSKPIRITVTGSSNGLPAFAAPLVRARPHNARPQYTPDETVTVARVNL
jgi:hypothetical protein